MAEVTQIESLTEFEKTPTGEGRRWSVEMLAAKKNQDSWLKRADKVVRRFLDDRYEERRNEDTRVNLFTANVQTMRALLYGKSPKVDVKRRFADSGDEPARIAGEILQRMLNTDIDRDSDTFAEALEKSLDDRLLPGLGVAKCRYEAEFEDKEIDPIPDTIDDSNGQILKKGAPGYTKKSKVKETVEIDYIHFRDFRWSPARTWEDVRWIAFKVPMTKDQLRKRFGEQVARVVPLNMKSEASKMTPGHQDLGEQYNPWSRAEVWEIWSKEERKVHWWVEGYPTLLDSKDDILGLEGFWPAARPMFANLTTTQLIPTPDFTLAQDLYDEVDLVSTRITLLERAIAVRGVYDKTSPEISRLLDEAGGNQLIPVDNFALFKEKGGLQSVVDWLPLDQIVGALDVLRGYRTELLALLYQITGMSDIMRGQSSDSRVTATEQAIKAKFASTRVQELQNEFARFASDLQSIKAEIISKHFDPQTIIMRSNLQYMPAMNPQSAQEAVAIIKSDFYQYRIEVKPESVALADMTAMKQERSEFLMAVATFLQSSAPIIQGAPWMGPYLGQMLLWAMSGFRGGATIEGVLEQMIQTSQQAAQQAMNQPPPPDPKVEAMKMKAQIDAQKAQSDIQMDMQKNQMEIEKMKLELQIAIQKAHLELATLKEKAGIEQAKGEADLQMKQQEQVIDAETAKMEIQNDARRMAMEGEAEQERHTMTMEQAREKHEMGMKQAKEKAKARPAPGKGGSK